MGREAADDVASRPHTCMFAGLYVFKQFLLAWYLVLQQACMCAQCSGDNEEDLQGLQSRHSACPPDPVPTGSMHVHTIVLRLVPEHELLGLHTVRFTVRTQVQSC